MRIDAPTSFYAQNYETGYFKVPASQQTAQEPQKQPGSGVGGVIVDISPEGREAARKIKMEASNNSKDILEGERCETCANRKYQDVSNDPSVSFQTPTKIAPGAAASAVAAHESEHVAHEKAKAEREGREIVNQTVTLKTGICPECHRMYVSGGVTRTTSVKSAEPPVPEQPSPQDTPS
jgi:hypothetical protein